MIRALLKWSEKVLADHLPSSLYFHLQDRLRPVLDRRTVKSGRAVRKLGDVYEVRWANGERFYFPHPRRYCRYMRPDGVNHAIEEMLAKYQDDEVQIERGDIVFEVGANVGEFTLAAMRKGATVFAAEPDPMAFACLRRNAPEASLTDSAIGNRDGSADLYLSPAGADSSLINASGKAANVRLRTVASWMKAENIDHIDFLKIEAEGFEPEILEGAKPVFGRVSKIAIDCGPERHGKPTLEQCQALLSDQFRTWRRGWMLFGVARCG